jgi:L-malate glycosyltransferase
MPAIHQLVAGFTTGDAISNEALVLQRMFRSWGNESEIFCAVKHTFPEYRKTARDLSTAMAAIKPADIAVLHLSTGSPVNDIFALLKCRKAIVYHNMTPSRYFDLVNRAVGIELEKGRGQMKKLAGVAEVNTAVSGFNARELESAGYRNVRVLPLILDLEALVTEPEAKIMRLLDDGKVNVLFVGRGVMNKRIDDAITAFSYFHRYVEPNSRFIHAGSYTASERYYIILSTYIKEMGFDSRTIMFAGPVKQDRLNAFYRKAHLFLCTSEHEGFCIPLLESMVHHVPVLAYAAAAVPETLDGAGVLFKEKNFPAVAEMMGKVVHDSQLRAAVISGQDKRIERYRKRDLAAELRECLAPLLV